MSTPTFTNTKITLFDLKTSLPSGRAMSPFTQRVRYILNYKQLAYKTQWTELLHIEEVSEKYGFKPTGFRADGITPRYTLPAILDETSETEVVALSDSYTIIQYLESTYPDPNRPIFPSLNSSDISAPALHLIANAFITQNLLTNFRPLLLENIYRWQTDLSKPKWLFIVAGASQLNAPKKGTEVYQTLLNKTKENFEVLATSYAANDGQEEWIMGDKPTFTDFVVLGCLMMIKLASEDDLWQIVKALCGGKWERFLKAGEKYMELK